jgi:hypothetical protein
MISPHTAATPLGHAGADEQRAPRAAPVLGTRPWLRATLPLARAEGCLLARNILVAGGLVVAAVVAWSFLTRGEPLWWKTAWQLGYAQMILSAVVVVATHLAAGRAQRNNMDDLYGSFPVTAGTRTAGHLLSVLGAVPASLILVAAASAVAGWRGVFGSPDPAVLVGGVLLVIAGGMIGVAVGRRFPHPFVGVLAALAWAAPFSQSNRFNGAITWLFPWVISQQLGNFPHPVSGYPPGVAHAVELAGIAALTAVVALAWHARAVIARAALLTAGAMAVAVIAIAGAVQLQPISTSNLNRLVAQASTPTRFQTCTTADEVRYCVYPDFASLRSSMEGTVNAVLAYVPVRPKHALSVEQAASLFLGDTTLTHGHPAAQVDTWTNQLAAAPVNHPSRTDIFIGVGSWPASNSAAATTARLQLALAAADWAVGLPPSAGSLNTATPCMPFNQAREPIAIWMTLEATHTQVKGIQDLGGEGRSYLAAPGPEITGAGYLLAQAMTRLSVDKVTQIIDRNWTTWTDPHTTDAQLASALGIPLPAVPTLNPEPGPGMKVSPPVPGTATPQVCTA